MNAYWLGIIQTALNVTILLVAILGAGLAGAMPNIDRWSKRFFMCFFAILVLSACALLFDQVAYTIPGNVALMVAADYLVSLLLPIPISIPALYLLHCCNEDWRKSGFLRCMFGVWVVYLVLLGISVFVPRFYYYTSEGGFALGPLYPLLIIPMVTILGMNLAAVVQRRDKLSAKRFRAFLVFLLPLTVAMVVHMCVPAFALVYVGVAVSSLAMFVIVVSDQVEQYMHLQQETTRQRAKIAVLQMRPHFIHNTMTSIYYLCDQDPKAAQRVTMDFNTYLRKNFNAIAKDETIPFSEELEHTRAYLAVEQAQFASKLVVDFDVPHTQFRTPPLTLQPLAENAIKHGMGPETIPLRVTIRTRKVGTGNEIVVEDNGPGFDPKTADGPHTTLANIRQRLDMMCGGRLEFEPRDGGGTVARVTIP